MAGKKDITVMVLRQIRDEIRGLGKRIDGTNERIDATREELSRRIDATNERLDGTNERLSHVEAGLLELAQQQRFVVKHMQALTTRDRRLEHELTALRDRVTALELRLDSE